MGFIKLMWDYFSSFNPFIPQLNDDILFFQKFLLVYLKDHLIFVK